MEKEKIKTGVIVFLLIACLILIISCRPFKCLIILPGHSEKRVSAVEKEFEIIDDPFEYADSMFNDKYNFPLTR